MFKGIGKQVVVLKNPDSKIFEEAIFIIKDGTKVSRPDMITECERIIKDNCTSDYRRAFTERHGKLLWFGGALLLTVIGITALVISLL